MITEFIAYLQGAGLTPSVQFAFTSEPIEDYTDDLPAILVYPTGDSASPSGADNLVIQAVSTEIVCLLGCAIGDYETLKNELRAASIGWVTGDYDAFEFAGSSIEGLKGGYIWWRESYSTRSTIRQTI
ncbi:MAG: hypothetical protein ACI9DH_000558 [Halioglobus sp.]|jgi:hypothetical protein